MTARPRARAAARAALAAAEVEPDEIDDDLDDDFDDDDRDVDTEDFDAYWRQREAERRPKGIRIRDVLVIAPTDLPIEFELDPRFREAATEEEYREVLDVLLGSDTLDELVNAKIGLREMQLLTTWAMAHGSGRQVTLAEADGLLQQAEDGQGKNRAARRAAARQPTRSGGRSARTGR